jgi:hypothetical protein
MRCTHYVPLFLATLLTSNFVYARELAEAVRALGWAPSSAELRLAMDLPRPPTLISNDAKSSCSQSSSQFESSTAESAWKRRRPARALTIWGLAHDGNRVATLSNGELCQDLQFLSRRWQAALGRPVTGRLTEFEVAELSRAIGDAEWGRKPLFGNLTIGVSDTSSAQVSSDRAPSREAGTARAKRDKVERGPIIEYADFVRLSRAQQDQHVRRNLRETQELSEQANCEKRVAMRMLEADTQLSAAERQDVLMYVGPVDAMPWSAAQRPHVSRLWSAMQKIDSTYSGELTAESVFELFSLPRK